MPFVNVKLVRDQVDAEMIGSIVQGLTGLLETKMNRNRGLTTIVVDEVNAYAWNIGGRPIDPKTTFVSFVNIKVSRGTTNPEEMSEMLHGVKTLMSGIMGNHVAENYCIIDELSPDGWGFDGVSMSQRARMEG